MRNFTFTVPVKITVEDPNWVAPLSKIEDAVKSVLPEAKMVEADLTDVTTPTEDQP